MTTSSSPKFPLLLIATPTDRTAAAAEDSSIWQFSLKSWSEQIDELVLAGNTLMHWRFLARLMRLCFQMSWMDIAIFFVARLLTSDNSHRVKGE